MTDKDSNDMTASEMLRWSANYTMYYRWGNPWNKLAIAILGLDPEKARAQEVHVTDAFSRLADKIDAELAQARELSLRRGAELWAKANGWPDFKEGEDFGAWLDRCAIPRPRFEDGEPVQIGDKAEHPTTGETCTIDCINTFDDSICIGFLGSHPAVDLRDGDRLKRPATEVLGADGRPIVVGEKVWLDEEHSRCAGSSGSEGGYEYSLCGIERQEMLTVEDAHHEVCGRDYIRVGMCNAWCHSSWLTHTPPDTQQKIDEDAEKFHCVYFGGYSACGTCPASTGELSKKSCKQQQIFDLLRRQRELDARKGGAE